MTDGHQRKPTSRWAIRPRSSTVRWSRVWEVAPSTWASRWKVTVRPCSSQSPASTCGGGQDVLGVEGPDGVGALEGAEGVVEHGVLGEQANEPVQVDGVDRVNVPRCPRWSGPASRSRSDPRHRRRHGQAHRSIIPVLAASLCRGEPRDASRTAKLEGWTSASSPASRSSAPIRPPTVGCSSMPWASTYRPPWRPRTTSSPRLSAAPSASPSGLCGMRRSGQSCVGRAAVDRGERGRQQARGQQRERAGVGKDVERDHSGPVATSAVRAPCCPRPRNSGCRAGAVIGRLRAQVRVRGSPSAPKSCTNHSPWPPVMHTVTGPGVLPRAPSPRPAPASDSRAPRPARRARARAPRRGRCARR